MLSGCCGGIKRIHVVATYRSGIFHADFVCCVIEPGAYLNRRGTKAGSFYGKGFEAKSETNLQAQLSIIVDFNQSRLEARVE